MSVVTISDTGSGPYRCETRVDTKYYRLLYTKSEWNTIMRVSLQAGGQKFIDDYLPMRFTNYARAMLGYAAKGRGLPLVRSGLLRSYVLTHSIAKATYTTNSGTLRIKIPTPEMVDQKGFGVSRTYATNPLVNRVLSTITAYEIHVIDKAAQQILTALIEHSKTVNMAARFNKQLEQVRPSQQRMHLSTQQRNGIKAGVYRVPANKPNRQRGIAA